MKDIFHAISCIFFYFSGFSRWEATKAQMYTAGVGLIGALVTLFLGTSEVLGKSTATEGMAA